ncbi:MAG: hydroxyethylthiazole kinase [Acidobacteriota bacterium]
MNDKLAKIITHVRAQRPLIQAITNYVTINDCANALLSFGASPAMCEASEEVEEFAGVANAVYLNIGTLITEQREAMVKAARIASFKGTPIVLDPVAAGGISGKTDYARVLLEKQKISIVKGNSGEIKALAGFAGNVRGVDSADDGENIIEACKELANKYETVAVATGETDTISDGTRVVQIQHGHPLLTRVTGTGCMLGAVAAATAAVEGDFFLAAASAVLAFNLASEIAAGHGIDMGPGTFRVRLMDSMHYITEQDIINAGKVTWL